MSADREYNVAKKQNKESGCGSWISKDLGQLTMAVHGGHAPDVATGAIVSPIYMCTTYVQDSIEEYLDKGYSYTRSGNPTVDALGERIAALEGGAAATCYSTGMAATCTVMTAFLKAGDHLIITDCSYGGTNRAVRVMFADLGIEYDFVDMTDLDNVVKAIKPNTKMVFSETPANPTLTLIDLKACSAICKEKGLVHVCDSTFATPIMTKPLDHGVDVVLHSTTKFFDGHNVNVGGALIARTKEINDKIKLYQNINGNIMSPMVAFYHLQAVKTLPLRIKQQSASADAIARFLKAHPAVDKVGYPGLQEGHWARESQKSIPARQHAPGINGSMAWFEVKGGTESGRKLMNTIKRPWSLCENLGAIESIITCPAVMTHANMTAEARAKVGITDGFVRVSCGIEDTEDLISALKEALDALGV